MQINFKTVALTLTLLSSFFVQASHVLGVDITCEPHYYYTSDVKVLLKLYRDPSGVTLGNTQSITVKHDITSTTTTAICQLDSVEYLRITCNDSVEIYHYSSGYINTYGPTRFFWNTCCRAPGIDNISQVNAGIVATTLFTSNTGSPSAQFFGPQILAYPTDSAVEIDFSNFAVNGDSVYSELVPLREASGLISVPITLDSAYTFDHPFDTTRITLFNNQTSILTVLNPAIGTYAVAVKVSTFDSAGVLLTQMKRDVTIFILPNNGHVLQPEVEVLNVKASTLSQTVNNGVDQFTIYANDTLEMDFWVKPKSNSQAIPVVANVKLRGLWAEATQGGMCISGPCAGLTSSTGLLSNADSIKVHFKFAPGVNFLNGLDSVTQPLKLEYSITDSCGYGVTRSELFNVQVKKPTISTSTYSFQFCQHDSVQINISGDNTNLSWSPSADVNQVSNSKYYISPLRPVEYRVYNLNDSSFIVIDVQVDSVFAAFSLSVANGIMVLPSPYDTKTSWSYINGTHTNIHPNYTPIDFHGKYWVKLASGNYCQSFSDTIIHMDPNIAVSSSRCDGEIVDQWNVNASFIYFKPVNDNTILKRFRILFDDHPGQYGAAWQYELFESGSSVTISQGNMQVINQYMLVDSISVNLLASTTYVLKFSPVSGNTYNKWLQYKPPSLPFVDENNIIEYISGIMLHPQQNGTLPFIEMEVKQPNIGLLEQELLHADVYPNPFKNEIAVKVNDQGNYILIDALGRRVQSGYFRGDFSLETESLSRGMYVLRLNSKGKTTSVKLIK